MTSRQRKSRRRSGTNIPLAKRLERHTFYVERSLGGKVVIEALLGVGLNIERHKDHFIHNAEDVEWLPYCGQMGWVVLTKDKAIRSNELELDALLGAGVAAFVIISGEMTGEDMAKAYTAALPQIARFLENRPRPFIARISPQGAVEMWIDSTGKDRMKADQERRRKRHERRKRR